MSSFDVEVLLSDTNADINTKLAGASGVVVRFEPGVYIIDTPLLPASRSVLDLTGATLTFDTDTANTALISTDGADDVEIMKGTFDGNVANQATWNEHRHAIRVRGSEKIRIHDNSFVNLVGDGVYVASLSGGDARSDDVWIQNNTFIGTNVNRNGVSIIATRQCYVLDNYFYRMGRIVSPIMPGAIDVEPNGSTEIAQEIVIRGNTIDGGPVTGTAVQAGINVINVANTPNIDGVIIDGNSIQGNIKRAIYILGSTTQAETQIVIVNNQVRLLNAASPNYGVRIDDADAVITGNSFENIGGFGVYQWGSSVCVVSGNKFAVISDDGISQGNSSAQGVYVGNLFRSAVTMIRTRGNTNVIVGNWGSGMTNGHVIASGTGNIVASNKFS